VGQPAAPAGKQPLPPVIVDLRQKAAPVAPNVSAQPSDQGRESRSWLPQLFRKGS
jgi:hypothetical protein